MFERFTDEARRAVVLAQDLARQSGHTWIGTEHLLLALLDEPEGITTLSLLALEVDPEAVRREIELIVPPTAGEVGRQIPFTPRAKKVLELALREAMRLRQRNIDGGHILLGLIREGEGVAIQALVQAGADLQRLSQDVNRRLATLPHRQGRMIVRPDIPEMTRGGVDAFHRARELASGKPVGSQHVLLGLFGEEDTLAKRALANLGVTKEAVEQQLAGLDATDTADEPPDKAGARRTRLQVAGDVVTLRIEDKDLASHLGLMLKRWSRPGEAGLIEVSGSEPRATEPFARLWRTAEGVSRDIAQRLGMFERPTPPPAGEEPTAPDDPLDPGEPGPQP